MGKFIDMTGWVMAENGVPDSRLTIIKRAEDHIYPSGLKEIQWWCSCSCGNEELVLATTKGLRNGDKKSCGCLIHQTKPNFIDMTNWVMKEHGIPNSRIKVIRRADDYISPKGERLVQWECECLCGNPEHMILLANEIRSGSVLSCGCYHKELSSKICKERNVIKYQNVFVDKGSYCEVYDNNNNMFIIDVDDKELVSKTYWAKYDGNNYFKSSINGKNVWLQRFLEDALEGEYVDHQNNQFCDYRKSNLRICDNSENNRNIGLKKNNTSGVTGVRWRKDRNKWEARITIYGELKHLGLFVNKKDAIVARLEAEDKYFGDFSYKKSQEASTYVQ